MEVKNILKNSSKYDFERVEKELNQFDDLSLIEVLKSINYNVNLINQRESNNSSRVKNFVNNLENFYKSKKVETNIFDHIRKIESFYAWVLEERTKILGEVESKDIVPTLFLLVNHFYMALKGHDEFIKTKEFKFIEEVLNVKTNFFDGNLIDSNVEEVSTIFKLNILASAYENNWINNSKEIIIPIELFTKEKIEEDIVSKIEITKKIAINSGLWDIVEDLDFRFRFFEDEVLFKENEIVHTQKIHEELGKYAIIANKRFERMMTQNILDIAPIIIPLLKGKDEMNYHSLYLSTCAQFYNLYYVNIETDTTEYKGLTLKEWLKSLIALNEISKRNGFNLIKYPEVFSIFEEIGIPKSKNKIILDNFTFKTTSSDLYDAPILRFTDNSILIFPISMWAPNYIYIINSIFSSYNLNLKDKGYDFEDNVVSFLKEKNRKWDLFSVSNPKYTFKREEYQFDAILEWDDFIFIIECKNRSVPNTKPISLKNFREKSNEYLKQIKRLQEGLENHPNCHNINLNDKVIIPIVLNSLPFALDYRLDNVFFLDYSSFAKFFNSKSLSLKFFDPQGADERHVIHNNWVGEKPSVSDFLTYINDPYQVSELVSRLKSFDTTHMLNDCRLTLNRYYLDHSMDEFHNLV